MDVNVLSLNHNNIVYLSVPLQSHKDTLQRQTTVKRHQVTIKTDKLKQIMGK